MTVWILRALLAVGVAIAVAVVLAILATALWLSAHAGPATGAMR